MTITRTRSKLLGAVIIGLLVVVITMAVMVGRKKGSLEKDEKKDKKERITEIGDKALATTLRNAGLNVTEEQQVVLGKLPKEIRTYINEKHPESFDETDQLAMDLVLEMFRGFNKEKFQKGMEEVLASEEFKQFMKQIQKGMNQVLDSETFKKFIATVFNPKMDRVQDIFKKCIGKWMGAAIGTASD